MQHLFGPPNKVEHMCTVLYATMAFLTLVCVDVAEKVGMAPKHFSHTTATTLFSFVPEETLLSLSRAASWVVMSSAQPL